jgi:GLPGLI family protein
MNLFEKTYLTSDSLKKLNWKISGETREIAGFECKKAIATILDSVVVVAFYTDEITPSTGPLGFNGLPGTILGFAIPRLYLTLFATKVERMDTPIKVRYKPVEKFSSKKTAVADLKKVEMSGRWKDMMMLQIELK